MRWNVTRDLRFPHILYVTEGNAVRAYHITGSEAHEYEGYELVRNPSECTACPWREISELVEATDKVLGDHKKTVRRVALGLNVADGFDWLITCSFDGSACLYIRPAQDNVNPTDWCYKTRFEGHGSEMKAVTILRASYDGAQAMVAACCRDKSVWLYAYQNGEFACLDVLSKHTQDVKFVERHPFLPLLVSTSYDNATTVYAPQDHTHETWTDIARLTDHQSTVWMAAFDATGTQLYTVGADGTMYTYESEIVKERRPKLLKIRPNLALSMFNSGKVLATVPNDWRLVDEFHVSELDPTIPPNLPVNLYTIAVLQKMVLITSSLGDIYVREDGKWSVIPNAHDYCEVNSAVWIDVDNFASVGDDNRVRLWTRYHSLGT